MAMIDDEMRLREMLTLAVRAMKKDSSSSVCPNSSTMVDYVLGGLDQPKVQKVSGHIICCDHCFDDFFALLGPEKIRRMLDGEQVVGTA
jgi:hypothetical protein